MKQHWADRVFAVVLAACFVLAALMLVAEGFFGVQMSSFVVLLCSSPEIKWVLLRVLIVLLLLAVAWRILCLALKRNEPADPDFVEQKTGTGMLRVSVKAVEGLVRKSVARHEEMELMDVKLRDGRDGLILSLRCNTAADISIPLAVEAMEKQLKQYILESTGLTVSSVHVNVYDAEAVLNGGTYRLSDDIACAPAAAEFTKIPHETEAENEAGAPDGAEESAGAAPEEHGEGEEAVTEETVPQDADEPATAENTADEQKDADQQMDDKRLKSDEME